MKQTCLLAADSWADTSTPITFTATVVNSDDSDSRQSFLVNDNQEILSAWEFSTEGHEVGPENPVYLSLHADSADDLLSLTVWPLVDGDGDGLDLLSFISTPNGLSTEDLSSFFGRNNRP